MLVPSLCAVGLVQNTTQPLTELLALFSKQPESTLAGWMYANIIPSVSFRKNVF